MSQPGTTVRYKLVDGARQYQNGCRLTRSRYQSESHGFNVLQTCNLAKLDLDPFCTLYAYLVYFILSTSSARKAAYVALARGRGGPSTNITRVVRMSKVPYNRTL